MAYQYKIPQNVDIEDRIIGPFTLRQFLYILAGGSIDYILFVTLAQTNFTLFIVLVVPISLLSLALALVKVNDRPFLTFVGYFLLYSLDPKTKTWKKSVRLRDVAVRSASEVEAGKVAATARGNRTYALRSRLSELSNIIDNKGAAGIASLGADRAYELGDSATRSDILNIDDNRVQDLFLGIDEDSEAVSTQTENALQTPKPIVVTQDLINDILKKNTNANT